MKKNFIIILILLVVSVFLIVGSDEKIARDLDAGDTQIEKTLNIKNTYKSISSSELDVMLKDKDFTLIDVHIPEQRHIPKTDYVIDFNKVDEIESVLKDKNEKIVLYCRSGGMSKIAAEELIKRGYKNVYELRNGLNEWVSEGRESLDIGSIK